MAPFFLISISFFSLLAHIFFSLIFYTGGEKKARGPEFEENVREIVMGLRRRSLIPNQSLFAVDPGASKGEAGDNG